jgi:hypothetical protein
MQKEILDDASKFIKENDNPGNGRKYLPTEKY